MASTRSRKTIGILGLTAALVAAATALGVGRAAKPEVAQAPTLLPPVPAAVPVAPLPAAAPTLASVTSPFLMPTCEAEPTTVETEVGNPEARKAAQRGIRFLEREAVAWQNQNNCYGCHVQAVTVEALAVGFHHQYDIRKPALDKIVGGMLTLSGGARGPQGLFHGDPRIGATAKVLGAAAFARYDQYVNDRVRKDLLREAKMILARQRKSGEVSLPWVSAPVAISGVQGTAQAIVTWKRAYDRTADDQWLTAIQRAEDYLQRKVEGWKGRTPDLQTLDYAIMGLLAAGVGTQEDLMVGLANQLRELQRDDGGWALARGQRSSPFATGQAVYTLRLLGMGDRDPAIARGTKWLITRQNRSGGWSVAGFGKAEAMWAVLGLVSIDVVSIHVAELQDGQRVEATRTITISAHDNQGGGVVKMELELDDQLVAGSCGQTLSWTWPAAQLGQGRRVLEVRATNARGEVAKRRVEVFTGDTFMTQVGSRFAHGATELSLRNLTTAGRAHVVALAIYPATADGQPHLGKCLWATQAAGAQGPMRFSWNGRAEGGAVQPAGKYVARLEYRDAAGAVRQTEDLPFVHDTTEKQLANYGQIQGAVSLPGGGGAANTEIQLIDEAGNVVGRTRSTAAGQYRFRNVDAEKKYKVVVRKDGFDAAPVAAAPSKAGEVQADIAVERK